jgi:hypothetical protein
MPQVPSDEIVAWMKENYPGLLKNVREDRLKPAAEQISATAEQSLLLQGSGKSGPGRE